ncbi:hypothetical protein PDRPv_23 [Mycobacterium phage PDRPv]|uniref:Uncharacterized protein n=1 Tax=Mycobacterium phage PDRPv TaxID=1640882 RepID=A0A162CH94_9CAUD|nr:hypothetical protein PDRPv_23 [Mycobacterium phage PDRPv]
MTTVVIEGSILPCGFLARGERVEVQRTAHIDRLIEQGFVNVISEIGDPEPAPLPEPVKAPARARSRSRPRRARRAATRGPSSSPSTPTS